MPDYDFFLAPGAAHTPAAGVGAGEVALWRGSSKTDFAPAIDPKAHLDKVKFHSSFDYPRCIGTMASTDTGRSAVTLPDGGVGTVLEQNDTLFAHGLGFAPLFFSEITIDGYKQPGDGSPMPFKKRTLPSVGAVFCPRWIGITSDDTNFYMHSRGWYGPATTVHWKVWILNERFGVVDQPDIMIRFDPEEFVVPQLGKIDETHRFVRQASPGEFRFVGRRTMTYDADPVRPINYSDGVSSLAVGLNEGASAAGTVNVSSVECAL